MVNTVTEALTTAIILTVSIQNHERARNQSGDFTLSIFVFLMTSKEWYFYSHSEITELKSGKLIISFKATQLAHWRCRSPSGMWVPNSILHLLPRSKVHCFSTYDFVSGNLPAGIVFLSFIFLKSYCNVAFIQHNDQRYHCIYSIHFNLKEKVGGAGGEHFLNVVDRTGLAADVEIFHISQKSLSK